MRPSEILGLQWQDLDVDSVWVRRRVFKSNVDTPKNERSARRVALSNGTARLLNEWLQDHVGPSEDAWLFPSETLKTPLRRNNLWRRNFAPKLKPVHLEWANFQVMRRSFASLAKTSRSRCSYAIGSHGEQRRCKRKRVRGQQLRSETGGRSQTRSVCR